ncbi:MAG: polysaccharide pyruvyl transferase family protein [Pirellulales bacterium]|nr:polysaccharide pyruvyl transferase family protein [Pirellulales bacterium]
MSKRIVISGWYGHGNVGDEAILQAMLDTFRKDWPDCDVTVLSCQPQYTRDLHNVKAVYQLPGPGLKSTLRSVCSGRYFKTLMAISKCDLFIMGGGGFLTDWIPDVPRRWLGQMRIAKLFGKRTMLYRIGAGPFSTKNGKRLTKHLINTYVDEVTVRENYSYAALTECVGVDSSKVTVRIDPVATMDVGPYQTPNDGKLSLVYTPLYDRPQYWNSQQCAKWSHLRECFMVQVRTLLERGQKVRLLSFQPALESEHKLADEFRAAFSDEVDVVFPRDFREAISYVSASVGVISLRLHGNIIAYALGKPFLPIIYHHKTKGFLDMIGYQPENIVLETGDGMNWPDLPLVPDEWQEKTNGFLDLLSRGEIGVFYKKRHFP